MNSFISISILQPFYYIKANFYLSIIKFTGHKGVLTVRSGKTNMNDKKSRRKNKTGDAKR